MKKLWLLASIVLTVYVSTQAWTHHTIDGNIQEVQWLVVGAGPAGIATIGMLHDLGIPYELIAWVDPEFNVGRIGEYYASVPANNNNSQFINFVNACATFHECTCPELEALRHTDPTEFSTLGIIIPALRELSAYLRTKLISYKGWLQDLHFEGDMWRACINGQKIHAHSVVLATGSHPRELNYEGVNVIPLDHALDKAMLASYVEPENTIGVIGGSHSGILILKYLYELGIKQIINLYRGPIVYPIDMGGWNLNAYTGLKGITAQWAREVLEGPNPPKNILRIHNDEAAREAYLPQCDKVIYSVGYEPNQTPLTQEYQSVEYDDKTGVIAPNLFGIGIAFPQYYCDPLGNEDHRVGIKSFMDYAQSIIPQWVHGFETEQRDRFEMYKHQKTVLEQFADLFMIDVL